VITEAAPISTAGEERGDERSNVGMSPAQDR